VERKVFPINVLLGVTLRILAKSHRFDWSSQSTGILVERHILAVLALVSLLAVVLIGRNGWVKLERFRPRLGRLTLIHPLVIGSFAWLAGHQVLHLIALQELLLVARLFVVLQ
jgi:hypothetical protein